MREAQIPLLEADERAEEIDPAPSLTESDGSKPNCTDRSHRLASLDVFRGLTVALMILVDDAGGSFPSINHSPWFGVTLADFVMPFFLFVVGFSIGLVFKRINSKSRAIRKVLLRSIKLFLLGLLLQGGYFHGRHRLTYGVDVSKIRWMGVLQRISIGYLLASISEIILVGNILVDSAAAFVRKYFLQWLFAAILCSAYICMLYGLYVPNWEYEVPRINKMFFMSSHGSRSQAVTCGIRGSLTPPCNAVGFIDRVLLGKHHLYQRPVYRRTQDCSTNSPDYGPLPPNAPGWCLAPFDPEGILSSLMAAVTCFIGLHYGHIAVNCKSSMRRAFFWSLNSLALVIFGYILELLGIPLSKPLYTVSYMLITAGASGFLFTVLFYIVDVKQIQKPTKLFQWMGMNALIIYALAACDLFSAALQGFYWDSPENNLIDGTEALLRVRLHSRGWGTLAFVMLEIICWGLVAGFLHKRAVYLKM